MSLIDKLADARAIRALLTAAEQDALRGGDGKPGVEHLVLAALELPDGTGAAALARHGTTAERLRAAVADVHAGALESVGVRVPTETLSTDVAPAPPGVYRSGTTMQQAFQRAVDLKRSTPRRRLLGAHVVAAACEQERGTFPLALQRLGVDRRALAATCRELLGA